MPVEIHDISITPPPGLETRNPADQDPAPRDHPEGVPGRPGTPFEGAQVAMAPVPDAPEPEQERVQGRERLSSQAGKLAGKLANATGGALGILAFPATLTLSAVATAMAYPLAALRDRFSNALQTAQTLQTQLGAPVAGGVWGREIETQNFTVPRGNRGLTIRPMVAQVMEQYRRDLGSGISHDEMRRYINMGERIVDAIQSQNDYAGGPIQVTGADGTEYDVSPNLETTRAISWYLQAKAVADNAGNRDPVVLQRGSMVVQDPGGRLFRFLKSAPNTYGRASTHFNERSVSDTATLRNTGIAGAVAGLKGQKAQYGIEDFSNRMPSGRGCLVFDQLQGRNGQPQTYLKWESVGMPSFLGFGTHADRTDGWAAKVRNRFLSQFRCLGHTFNFLRSLRGGTRQNWGVHREAVHKGEPKTLYEGFRNIMEQAAGELGKEDEWAQSQQRDAKRYGLYFIVDTLNDPEAVPGSLREKADNLLREIGQFSRRMGNDLGIERKGAEIHVSLEPQASSAG